VRYAKPMPSWAGANDNSKQYQSYGTLDIQPDGRELCFTWTSTSINNFKVIFCHLRINGPVSAVDSFGREY